MSVDEFHAHVGIEMGSEWLKSCILDRNNPFDVLPMKAK